MLGEDNWKHRATHMQCRTCMWFIHKDAPEGAAQTLGRCRRRAPTMSGFPVVFESDWCGDHKVDETKLLPVIYTVTDDSHVDASGTARPGGF